MSTLCTLQCYAQRTFNFNIDHQQYSIDEKTLNDMFGDSFNSLVNNRSADNDKFKLWLKSFSDWKDIAADGVWSYEVYGDRLASSTYGGSTKNVPIKYLGWKAEGKPASGNGNKESNFPRRMQLLNGTLSKRIIFYFTKRDVSTNL